MKHDTWKDYEAARMRARIADSYLPSVDEIIISYCKNHKGECKRSEIMSHVHSVTNITVEDMEARVNEILRDAVQNKLLHRTSTGFYVGV